MMRRVRTTLTIDDDLATQLHDQARRTGRTFRDVVNEALRDGLLRGGGQGLRTEAVDETANEAEEERVRDGRVHAGRGR